MVCRWKPSVLLIALLLAGCGGSSPGSAATTPPPQPPASNGSGGINDPDKRDLPYVVLVSFDGFRWDYQDLYDTPAMDRLTAAGVRATSMRPVYPSLTFPNHYSIATGLLPANHGIVANTFLSRDRQKIYSLSNPSAVEDGSWYGGEPAWVAAESSGIVAASYYFVGSEAEIGGVRPTYWQRFDSSVPANVRVDQVLQWLNFSDESRPHFITIYFEDADSAGHRFGPESAAVESAVAQLDQALAQLLDGIKQTPVNEQVYVILVSDHGMSVALPGSDVLILDDVIDTSGMTVVGNGPYGFLFLDEQDDIRARQIRDDINAVWQHGQAYTKDVAPAEWGITTESRFPDVIVQANDGFRVSKDGSRLAQLPRGMHGWNPAFADMHGIFLAAGPRLPIGARIDSISSVDVYPLLLELLEIAPAGPVDGNSNVLTPLLVD